ncbi:MAG: sigma-70 family RNA polymerase sigma factor [Planctomycetes bacterium]|nr:sigma-70 family RNA polymerase sigma factor [Planctomycetota bacterium]
MGPDPAAGGADASADAAFTRRYLEIAPALQVWAELRLGPELRGFCDAEDLLQEIWCRAFSIRDRAGTADAAFRPWLFRVAKNVLLEVLRAARSADRLGRPLGDGSSRPVQLDGLAEQITSVTRRLARDDTLREFHRRLAELPDDERELVLHVGLEGVGYTEAAQRLGTTHDALKKRWQRLRARLQTRGLPALLLDSVTEN